MNTRKRRRTRTEHVLGMILISSLGVQEVAPAQCTEFGKTNAADGTSWDYHGRSVDVDGHVAVVGAYGDDDHGSESGSAYVYRYDPALNLWVEEAKLTPPPNLADARDHFGFDVAIDGNVIVVGAYADDDLGANSGSVFIFRYQGSSWNYETRLLPSDGAANDQFGVSVAISGEAIVVGANLDDDDGTDSGGAYVFRYDSLFSQWLEEQKLTGGAMGGANDQFGRGVDIDGNRIAIGAHEDDDMGTNSGSAYVFRRNGTWSLEQKLSAMDGSGYDYFGRSVAIDEDLLIVGAYGGDEPDTDTGAAYAFAFDSDSSLWIEESKLVPCDSGRDDWFGFDVALEGHVALIGALNDDDGGSNAGGAYVFRRRGGQWHEDQKLGANVPGSNDQYGATVALSSNIAFVGAWSDNDLGTDSGSAYAYWVDELHLDIRPTTVTAGDTLTITTECGINGSAVAITVVNLNGIPVFLLAGPPRTFGADFKFSVAAPIPPGVPPGLIGTFQTFKLRTLDRCGSVLGGVVRSNPATVTFQ